MGQNDTPAKNYLDEFEFGEEDQFFNDLPPIVAD